MFSSLGRMSGRAMRMGGGLHRSLSDKVVVSSKHSIPGVTLEGVTRPISFPEFMLKNFKSEEHASEVAIVDGSNNASLTYSDLHDSTYSFAHALREQFGIGKDDTVAIYAPNHVHYFTVFQGIGLTGGRSTPINPLYTEDEVDFQMKMTGAKAIVAHPMCMETAKASAKKLGIPVISFGNCEGTTPLASLVDKTDVDTGAFMGVDPASIMTIPFSSGTTGNPKGVMLTHNNLVANTLQSIPQEVKWLAREHNDGERGAVLVPLPFFHIFGMIPGMCAPLVLGAKLIFLPAFDLPRFLELIQEHKVSRAFCVPPIVLALAKHPIVDNYDLSSLKSILSGAAPLGQDLQMACAKRLNVYVKQGWGMTELAPIGTIVPDPEESYANRDVMAALEIVKGSSGELAPATEAKIVCPESGEDLPWSEEGELLIRGPQVMKGYFDNEEATAATIRADGWMHTGDVAKFDAEGRLYITDRCKELIKYKGFQVAPAELEGLIGAMDKVADVIVIPVLDDEAGELPRAYVVKASDDLTEEEVCEHISSKVAHYKKLRGGVRFVDAVPKSASGKLLRRLMVAQDRAEGQ